MKKIITMLLILSLVLSSVSFVGVFAADTPVFTESFENGLGNWDYWNSTSSDNSKFTDEAYSEGKQSYYINDNSSTAAVGVKSPAIPVTPGESYTAYVDIYAISGSVKVYYKFMDKNGKQLTNTSQKGTAGAWTAVKIYGTAPEGAASLQIVLCTDNASLASGYYDNIRVYKGDVTDSVPSGAKAPGGTASTGSASVTVVEDNYKDGDVIMSESFESGLPSTWSVQGSVPVKDSGDMASEGSKSVYIEDDSDTKAGGIVSFSIPVAPGNTYSAVADVNNVKGSFSLFLKFFDENNKQLTSVSKSGGGLGEWETVSNIQIAPDGAKYAQIWLYTVKASLQIAYVDNVRFIKGKYEIPVVENPYIAPKQVAPVDAKIVAPVNNKLIYTEYNEQGDKIGDFSYGGFYAGEYELPDLANLPVMGELSPSGTEDDTKLIQDAIDKIYNEASDDRMKILKLKAGTYNINRTGITLKSGIVLVGEGQGPTGTILYAKDAVQYVPIKITGGAPKMISGKMYITDDYVKAGSKVIHVSDEDASRLKAGDLITVYHPSTDEWAQAIGMKGILNVYNDDTSWKEGTADFKSERTVVSVNGNEITLDFALFTPLNKQYSQSYIYKTDESEKIVNSGIDNLRIVSYYNGNPDDEKHATNAITISNAKNIFIRNVSAKHFYGSLVSSSTDSKQITVTGCSNLDPVSQVAGSRRYSFAASTSAQQLLYTGNYSYDGRHDYETSFTVTGPIAYVDNIADTSNTASETHGTWSTGVLFDNLYQIGNGTKGFFAMSNRGIYGTASSQGWSAASSLMWNCLATTMIAHKVPLTYQNFMVGTWGLYQDKSSQSMKESNIVSYRKIYRTSEFYNAADSHFETKEGTPMVGDAYKEGEFTPVEPRSLYKAQLSERFTGTIANARPNAPIIVYPRSDKVTDDKNLKVSGAYQLGATAVTVYIDDIAYNATLKPETCEFEFSMQMAEGVHKIYATQTINGVESVKNADRFITIGKENGNPQYLQSIYDSSKTRMIINDPRPTYDVYEKTIAESMTNKITVKVNGAVLSSDVEPFETQGRVLVPMRAIFEEINAAVTWDEATATATAVKDDTTVTITENQTTAYVNGVPVTLDVPATIVNGRFMVPVRFISESFGCDVGWIDLRKIVTIETTDIKFAAIHNLPGEFDIYKAIQSGDDGAGSIIDNVFDGNYRSGWGVAYDETRPDAAYGIFDLGSAKEIEGIHIAFTSGNARVYTFDIYVSDDNENYTLVKSGYQSSGTTLDLEQYPINKKARYVKIVGKGNSVNYWLNIKEVAITGK